MKVSVKVDPNTCILAANCVGITPKFFQIDEAPHVELLNGAGGIAGTEATYDATPEELELLHEAADSCPTRAILVRELR